MSQGAYELSWNMFAGRSFRCGNMGEFVLKLLEAS